MSDFDLSEPLRAAEFFRVLFQKANDAIFLVEGDGLRMVEVNEAACKLLGYSREELLALGVIDIVPPDKRHLIAGVRQSVNAPGACRRDQRFLLRKDGSTVATDHTLRRLEISGESYFLASARDLTVSLQAERELLEAKAFLEHVQEGASDGIAILDQDGVYVSVNLRLLEMHGTSVDHFIGRNFREITPPEDLPAYEEYHRQLLRGEKVRMRATIRHSSGREAPVDVSSAAFEQGGRKFVVAIVRDMTEAVHAEEALHRVHEELERRVARRTAELRESEERYRTLAENSGVGIWHATFEGKTIYANRETAAILGLADPRELHDGTFHRFFTAESLEVLKREHAKRRQGMASNYEVDIVRPDGSHRRVAIYGAPLREEDGTYRSMIGTFVDVSQQKQAGEELRESEQRFRQIAEHIRHVFYVTDPDHKRMQYISPAYEEVWGRPIQSLYERPLSWQESIHPEDRERVRSIFDWSNGRAGPREAEYRVLRPDGTVRWIWDRAFEILDDSGRQIRFVGFAEDITDRRRTEEELRQAHDDLERRVEERTALLSEEIAVRRRAEEAIRFQKTLLESQSEAAIDGILVVDRNGRMISFNRRFTEMWDIPAEVVESRSDDRALRSVLEKLVNPEEFMLRVRYLYAHPDEERRDEIALKDGRTFDRYSAPVRSRDGVRYGRVWYFRDVTGRKRTEEELRRAAQETRKAYEDLKQAQEQLIRSEKLASIGMLVSGVAHEINNPLNVMYGNLQLLAEQCARMGPQVASRLKPGIRKIRSMIRDALRAAQHAREIVEEFRSFARDTRTAEVVDLNVCLEEMASLACREMGPRVRLVKRLRPLPPVRCFRGQINQVFLNLLKNAGEAIAKKGTVTLRTRRRNGHVLVEVADTGRGMTEEIRNKLFEPFFTTKPVGKGLGLGLSISAMIVQNHGGRISVKTRAGRGSVFQVELPIHP